MAEKNNPIAAQHEKVTKSEANELADLSLSRPAPSPAALQGQKEPTASVNATPERNVGDKFSFSTFVHGYVAAGILLADQKAAFIFAIDTAFLGYLVTTIPVNVRHIPLPQQFLLGSALGLLVLSITSVIAVLIPRLGGDVKGLVYFKAIASRPTSESYVSEILRATQSELDVSTVQHTYEISKLCVRKYNYVRAAIWLGLVGFAAGMLWLAWLHSAALVFDPATV
jgi:hypothetical protein